MEMKTTIFHATETYIDWSQGAESLQWVDNHHPNVSPFLYLRDIRKISPYKLIRGECECPEDIKVTVTIKHDYTDKTETVVIGNTSRV